MFGLEMIDALMGGALFIALIAGLMRHWHEYFANPEDMGFARAYPAG